MRTARCRPSLDDWISHQLFGPSLSRRTLIGAISTLPLVSCSSSGNSGSDTTSAGAADTGVATGDADGSSGTGGNVGADDLSCVLIPEETAGPYPLFNDISSAAAYQREDITEGSPGVPMRLTLQIVGVSSACAPITTAMVYAWHCDANGYYSGYDNAGYDARVQTFLRGVQTCDSNGEVSFLTIYPGWYTGRATHIHFRVYLGLDLQATSQIAFPDGISDAVHVMAPYAKGVNSTRAAADGIFADGFDYQLATVTQDSTIGGYHAKLIVGIAA